MNEVAVLLGELGDAGILLLDGVEIIHCQQVLLIEVPDTGQRILETNGLTIPVTDRHEVIRHETILALALALLIDVDGEHGQHG